MKTLLLSAFLFGSTLAQAATLSLPADTTIRDALSLGTCKFVVAQQNIVFGMSTTTSYLYSLSGHAFLFALTSSASEVRELNVGRELKIAPLSAQTVNGRALLTDASIGTIELTDFEQPNTPGDIYGINVQISAVPRISNGNLSVVCEDSIPVTF